MMNEFLASLMDEAGLGMMVMDVNGVIVDISRMACEIFAAERSYSIGMHVERFFQHLPDHQQTFVHHLLAGKLIRDVPVSVIGFRQNYELLLESKPLTDWRGYQIGTYMMIHDVTHLRVLENQLRSNDRLAMIGQIAAGAAHEIRNPLTSIKGFIQLIKNSLANQDNQREIKYADIIIDEIERINHLVGEFLMLSKPKTMTAEALDLRAVLQEIIPIVEVEARLHDIHLHCQFSNHSVMIEADAEQLKQVILNLCKNGIEAMSKQGKQLTIFERINYQEHTVIVEIHDQGVGIPPFMIDKIFDPFFTTKENGTGLGLPICQRIIHDLGGQIRVSSKGFGTCMKVVLPILPV